MPRLHPLPGPPVVVEEAPAPALSPALEAEVARLWERERARRGPGLYNGTIFGLTGREGAILRGRWTEYRRLVAQLARPELFAELAVRPLAVSGLLWVEGGLLFGRRAEGLTQEAGRWELAPAGGLSPACRRSDGRLDPGLQLALELKEEVGCDPAALGSLRPLVLLEDEASHVWDLGLEGEFGLPWPALEAAHRRAGSDEYRELGLVRPEDLPGFLAKRPGRVVVASLALLVARGLLPAPPAEAGGL